VEGGGVLTTEGLIAGRQQWEVADREREKEWVKERGRGERGRIYNGNRGRGRRKMGNRGILGVVK
jgi:hypothetical protein